MTDSLPAPPEVPDFLASRRLVLRGSRALGALRDLVQNAGRFPPAHPFFLGSAEQFLLAVEPTLETRDGAAFLFDRGECFFCDQPLPLDEASAALIDGFAASGIRCILVRPGVTRQEAASFGRLLAGPDAGIVSGRWTDVFLNDQGIRHISLCGGGPSPARPDIPSDTALEEAATVFTGARTAFSAILNEVREGRTADSRVVDEIVGSLVEATARSRNAVIAAVCLRADDDYAVVHAVNVAALCLCFGRSLSVPPAGLSALGRSGLLHDVGKAASQGTLDAHPALGALVLSEAEGIDPACIAAVLTHHRGARTTGEGTDPSALRLSRIVAIADAFESLTALRVQFGLALSPVDAVRRLLREAGAGFDPAILKAFLSEVGLFPAGTALSLDSGEVAAVVRQGADPFRPLVRILNGTGRGAVISLAERSGGRYRWSPSCVLADRAAAGVCS